FISACSEQSIQHGKNISGDGAIDDQVHLLHLFGESPNILICNKLAEAFTGDVSIRIDLQFRAFLFFVHSGEWAMFSSQYEVIEDAGASIEDTVRGSEFLQEGCNVTFPYYCLGARTG